MKYNPFETFLTVLLFFSILHTGQTVRPIFTLNGSNDVYPRKDGPFGVRTIDDVIWGKYAPKNPKGGVNRQFPAKSQIFLNFDIIKTTQQV